MSTIQINCCLCNGNIFPNMNELKDLGKFKDNFNYQCYLLTSSNELIYYDRKDFQGIVTAQGKKYILYPGKNDYQDYLENVSNHGFPEVVIIIHRSCWEALNKFMLIQDIMPPLMDIYPPDINRYIQSFLHVIDLSYDIYSILYQSMFMFGLLDLPPCYEKDTGTKMLYLTPQDINLNKIQEVGKYLLNKILNKTSKLKK